MENASHFLAGSSFLPGGGNPLKRIFCLLSALLFLLPVPAARADEAAVSPAVEQARRSLVHLYGLGTDSETGLRSRWSGTGFAVGPAGEDSDIFLTNWHVATGSGKYADHRVELWLLKDNAEFDADQRPLPGSAVPCRVLITTDGYPDVAVIQAMEPVQGYKALPLLPSGRTPDGTKVFALGFPGLKDSHYGADSGPEDIRISSGTIEDHLTMTRAGNSRAVIHSAAIVPGFSGGPLVNEQGAVVAQNAYGFQEDVSSRLFCAIYIDYGMELLDRLSIPYSVARPPLSIRPILGAVLFSLLLLYAVKSTRHHRRAREENAHED